MVDLQKTCESYSLEYFKQVEKELETFPHFLALQKRYVEVGKFLSIEEKNFATFEKKWASIEHISTLSKNRAKIEKTPCSEKEKLELLQLFISTLKSPRSPKEVFTNF